MFSYACFWNPNKTFERSNKKQRDALRVRGIVKKREIGGRLSYRVNLGNKRVGRQVVHDELGFSVVKKNEPMPADADVKHEYPRVKYLPLPFRPGIHYLGRTPLPAGNPWGVLREADPMLSWRSTEAFAEEHERFATLGWGACGGMDLVRHELGEHYRRKTEWGEFRHHAGICLPAFLTFVGWPRDVHLPTVGDYINSGCVEKSAPGLVDAAAFPGARKGDTYDIDLESGVNAWKEWVDSNELREFPWKLGSRERVKCDGAEKPCRSRAVWEIDPALERLVAPLAYALTVRLRGVNGPHACYSRYNAADIDKLQSLRRTSTTIKSDFKNQDAHGSREVLTLCMAIARAAFPAGREVDEYFAFVWHHHIDRTLVVPGGFTYQFHQGWPSGSPLTTLIETLASLLVTYVGIYAHQKTSQIKAMYATGDDLEVHIPADDGGFWWQEVTEWITRTTGYKYGESAISPAGQPCEILGMVFDGYGVTRPAARIVSGVLFPKKNTLSVEGNARTANFKIALAGAMPDAQKYAAEITSNIAKYPGVKTKAGVAAHGPVKVELKESYERAALVHSKGQHTFKSVGNKMLSLDVPRRVPRLSSLAKAHGEGIFPQLEILRQGGARAGVILPAYRRGPQRVVPHATAQIGASTHPPPVQAVTVTHDEPKAWCSLQ